MKPRYETKLKIIAESMNINKTRRQLRSCMKHQRDSDAAVKPCLGKVVLHRIRASSDEAALVLDPGGWCVQARAVVYYFEVEFTSITM